MEKTNYKVNLNQEELTKLVEVLNEMGIIFSSITIELNKTQYEIAKLATHIENSHLSQNIFDKLVNEKVEA